ncbi:alpha/beta fold hydrolase [Streptomyces hirsutus]|uniref:alpha/beta fold hydrolase n=1 Tax=Streptomyces hirsutus TaxID=35620 RepID=UPI003421A454
MHGFPDSSRLYDRLLPHLEGRMPVVRFDFLGWGKSDKPRGYAYTAANQVGDLAAVADAVSARLDARRLVLVAHDASGPPVIDWALADPWRSSAPSTNAFTLLRSVTSSCADSAWWPTSVRRTTFTPRNTRRPRCCCSPPPRPSPGPRPAGPPGFHRRAHPPGPRGSVNSY